MTWKKCRTVHCPNCLTTWPACPVARDDGRWLIDCPICGILRWRAVLREFWRRRD